jgi:hypothetical protein
VLFGPLTVGLQTCRVPYLPLLGTSGILIPDNSHCKFRDHVSSLFSASATVRERERGRGR